MSSSTNTGFTQPPFTTLAESNSQALNFTTSGSSQTPYTTGLAYDPESSQYFTITVYSGSGSIICENTKGSCNGAVNAPKVSTNLVSLILMCVAGAFMKYF